LFNVLTAGRPAALENTVWLDLFAGSGTVGIEAISRGATMVLFVESAAGAAQLIRRNLTSLGIETGFQVVQQDAIRALRAMNSGTVADYIFLDPPYEREDAYDKVLSTLAESSLLKSETIVIAEHRKRFEPGEEFASLRRFRKLEQGDAALSFYRRV
jgi:16S rRNA (guanine(966)-N(2))-methyltransferase RsmD